MDEIDRHLLRLLREDASRPLKVLAAEVGLSRSSVRERIAKLQAAGVIRRFTVELAPEQGKLTAVLLVRLVDTQDAAAIERIIALPEVIRCRSLSGANDLLVEISASEMSELTRVRNLVAEDPGVADLETSFVLEQEKSPA